jgi:anti-sigma B factor antagonist
MTSPTVGPGAARQLDIRPYSLDEHRCVVALSGEIDLDSAPDLRATLNELWELGYTHYVFDLAEVTFLDSTGLGVLIGFQKRLEDAGARIAVAAVPPDLARLLGVVGLGARFETFLTVDAALAESGGPAAPDAVHAIDDIHAASDPSRQEPDDTTTSGTVAAADDAALVLGLASTALPFAESPLAEAERWLRILQRYGDAGRILRDSGVREAPLDEVPAGGETPNPAVTTAAGRLTAVASDANRLAAERNAAEVGTRDLLCGAISVYGADFDRVIAAHGGDAGAVHERLGLA